MQSTSLALLAGHGNHGLPDELGGPLFHLSGNQSSATVRQMAGLFLTPSQRRRQRPVLAAQVVAQTPGFLPLVGKLGAIARAGRVHRFKRALPRLKLFDVQITLVAVCGALGLAHQGRMDQRGRLGLAVPLVGYPGLLGTRSSTVNRVSR